MTSFRTGAATDSGGTQATSWPITIPGTIQAGDVIYLMVTQVPISSSVPVLTAASTATVPAQVDVTRHVTQPSIPATAACAAFRIVAGASDAGATLTFSSTITGFWSIALAAYPGASTASPEDVAGGTAAAVGTPTVTCPSETTNFSGDWAVYLGGGAAENGSLTIPAGATARLNDVSSVSVAAVICDSGGSVGAGGTGIGGGVFTAGSNANNLLCAFTIGLSLPQAAVPQQQLTPRRRPALPPSRAVAGPRGASGSGQAGPANAAAAAVPAPSRRPPAARAATPRRAVTGPGSQPASGIAAPGITAPAPRRLPAAPRGRPSARAVTGPASRPASGLAAPAQLQAATPPPRPRRTAAVPHRAVTGPRGTAGAGLGVPPQPQASPPAFRPRASAQPPRRAVTGPRGMPGSGAAGPQPAAGAVAVAAPALRPARPAQAPRRAATGPRGSAGAGNAGAANATAAGGTPPQCRTIPRSQAPRRAVAGTRACGYGQPGGANAAPAVQAYRRPPVLPRQVPARAVWHGGAGPANAAPAPQAHQRAPSWTAGQRRPQRAVWRRVTGTANKAPQAYQRPPLPVPTAPRRAYWRGVRLSAGIRAPLEPAIGTATAAAVSHGASAAGHQHGATVTRT